VSGLAAADAAADGARRAGSLGPRRPVGAALATAGTGAGGAAATAAAAAVAEVGVAVVAAEAYVAVGPPSVIRQTEADEPHVVAAREAVRAADAAGLLARAYTRPLFIST